MVNAICSSRIETRINDTEPVHNGIAACLRSRHHVAGQGHQDDANMKAKYKETSRGGLAINVIELLAKHTLICRFASFGAVRAFPSCTAKSP